MPAYGLAESHHRLLRGVRVMPFFVATYRQAWPDRVSDLLTSIKRSFEVSRTAAPGRHTSRVFQRLEDPTSLVSIGEWDNQAAYEAHHGSQAFEEATVETGPPPVIVFLRRIHLFERMNDRAAVVACVTITVPAERADSVESFLRGPAQANMVATPGIVFRELYRSYPDDQPTVRLLVAHGWRSIADLERFRRADAPHFQSTLSSLGANVERFTGEIAAQFSRLDQLTEA